jgi:hypothetical protein
MKGSLVDAMTDRIADGVRFAEQASWGQIEPQSERKQGRNRDQPAGELTPGSLSGCLFHCTHYMVIYDHAQERFRIGV